MFSILCFSDFSLGVLHFALALGVTALVLDLFLNTEILAHISAIIIALWVTVQILSGLDIHPFWYVLVYFIIQVLVEIAYFYLWRLYVVQAFAAFMTRHAAKEMHEAVVGFRGPVEKSGNQLLLHYLEEYLAIAPSCAQGLSEGMMVEVVEQRGSAVVVKRV